MQLLHTPPAVPGSYEEERRNTLARYNQVCAFMVIGTFIPLYLIDPLLPNLPLGLNALYWARTVWVLSATLIFLFSRTAVAKQRPDFMSAITLLFSAVGIAILTALSGGTASPYREALIGAYLMEATFLPFSLGVFIGISMLGTALFELCLWWAGNLGEVWEWGTNLVILALITMISSLIVYMTHRLRRALHDKNRSLSSAYDVIKESNKRTEADLQQARIFQQKLIKPIPTSQRVQIAAVYKPADLLGGDFYEVREMGPDWYRIFIADVTGHGTQAAIRTMIIQQQFAAHCTKEETPAALLEKMNNMLVDSFGSMSVVYCAMCVDVRRDANGWSYLGSNSGLPDPMVISGEGFSAISSDGTYQGVIESPSYSVFEGRLAQGDWAILATDGLVDLLETREMELGKQLLHARGSMPSAEAILENLTTTLPGRPADDSRADDLTALVVYLGDRPPSNVVALKSTH